MFDFGSNGIKIFLRKKIFFFKKGISNASRIFQYNLIYFIILKMNDQIGIGEFNPLLEKTIKTNKFINELKNICDKIVLIKKMEICYYKKYISYSSIIFGLEQVFFSLKKNFPILFYSSFYTGKYGIPINGLIWNNSYLDYSKKETIKKLINTVKYKVSKGFSYIKMKFNFHFFEYQYSMLKVIKSKYPFLKIRIDANGSFSIKKKKDILYYYIDKLYELDIIDSIEQPILSYNNDWSYISEICLKSKLPIFLDEDLVYVNGIKEKIKFLDTIMPQHIIIKPSINGGFSGSEEWILLANKKNIKWSISSSLESNIGINAISQWIFIMNKKYKNNEKHGLDTINVYTNNFKSPIEIKKSFIWYNPIIKWNVGKNLF
ncbi:enolase C-terminal domain-like protein [Blattabacterium cuenoti]|uniref:enolase C-terminal domain-like protein n=1 Tax=Blattabacterium cuenoti TaxID=1653831 RepID=UPI00163BB988|nr:enolase C-terminal domain-like protein [Blattabacterium cuenoti]